MNPLSPGLLDDNYRRKSASGPAVLPLKMV